jgi:hypothetical protein
MKQNSLFWCSRMIAVSVTILFCNANCNAQVDESNTTLIPDLVKQTYDTVAGFGASV